MIKNFNYILFTLVLLFSIKLFSNNVIKDKKTINWEEINSINNLVNQQTKSLNFHGAIYDEKTGNLPLYFNRYSVESLNISYSINLTNEIYKELTENEKSFFADISKIDNKIFIQSKLSVEKKQPFLELRFIPFRINPANNKLEKLLSFELEINYKEVNTKINKSKRQYASNSVLATGSWYKLAISKTGIYKLTYNELKNAGINLSSINPRNIRIYGNGGGMLPENTSGFRVDDLAENAIKVYGEEDGVFNENDYILFYAKGPHIWSVDSVNNIFHHTYNIYSEYSYYFLNFDIGAGKRISTEISTTLPPNKTITKFNDYAFHEIDSSNLIRSGRVWYGELFDILTNYKFSNNFPNIDNSSKLYFRINVAAQSTTQSSFGLDVNGNTYNVIVNPTSSATNADYAKITDTMFSFYPGSSDINTSISYNKTTDNSKGWLNYFEINTVRNLSFVSGQVMFRDLSTVGKNNVSKFELLNTNSNVFIWDVTGVTDVKQLDAVNNGGSINFTLTTDSLKEFIAFDGTMFNSAEKIEKIDNQNLHSLPLCDMVIVSYPDFITEANRLADIHRSYDNYTVAVVKPEQIYNEFSSGAQDITAIRDFMKMMYERGTATKEIKYLLMFGRASYDYKNKFSNNTNFVPSFESINSLVPTSSYVTDDYFGILDDNEGASSEGNLDIGVGRFPVKTLAEAKEAVDKVVRYIAHKNLLPDNIDPQTGAYAISNFADWRNMLCFVADDEDSNLHLSQAEQLANYVDTTYRQYNIDKIYFDAYKQYSTPGGQRYPDAKAAINDRVEKGALIINYTGHGGELGWAHERVLENSDINNWTNKYDIPVFMTATCEFSRFDDPELISAGEYVFLNQLGGSVAMFTTTRLAFSNSNYNLNKSFYENVFLKENGDFIKMGDIIRKSKVANASNPYIRNFVLLGDPAIRIAYPQYRVATISINEDPANTKIDTLKALSKVTIKGNIQDDNGNIITDFNGKLYPTVFDKPVTVKTLANDATSSVKSFKIQNSILYKGKVTVTNGLFEFSFIIPKDIMYNDGKGKISYYAASDNSDANGYYDNFIVGGTNTNAGDDISGPDIKLYIDNYSFVTGGVTGVNPILLAVLSDENGINSSGTGIGHNVTAVLDNNINEPILLDNYYESDLDTYKKGTIKYNFYNLAEGLHNLKLKAWDVYNNSAEASIDFYVVRSFKIYNFPNPFKVNNIASDLSSNTTKFRFERNYPLIDDNVNFQILIYNLDGMLVKEISSDIEVDNLNKYNSSKNTYYTEYEWDGKDDNSNYLREGIYIYKITVSTKKGLNVSGNNKIVIIR